MALSYFIAFILFRLNHVLYFSEALNMILSSESPDSEDLND
jgi:hypothetical protein